MELSEKIEVLGRAFCYGETDALGELLNENCSYSSDYAHRKLNSAEDILENMNQVHAAIQNDVKNGKNSTCTYEIVNLNSVLKHGVKVDDLRGGSFYDVYENGLLIYQFGADEPIFVVFIKTNPGGQITEIKLSRNHKWFDMSFYGENGLEDSEKDIPYTVKPMSSHDRQVKELQAVWTHQKHDFEELDDSEVYIWRQADRYFKQWLRDNDYYIIESQVFDDCIGYRCNRRNYAYTVYMYAYGQEQTTQLDGDYCSKLLDYKLSKESTVLVAYLKVKRFKGGGEVKYTVCNYAGDEDCSIYLWRVYEVEGKKILEFYPRKEMVDLTYRLMYAFNRDNRDVYDCIICDNNPAFNGLEHPGTFYNLAFYNNLFRLHKEYGDMKIGYVRYNDVIYSQIPYIEGYGFFDFRADSSDKIVEVTAHPFDGGDREVREFIKTDEKECDAWYSDIPLPVEVEALEPVFTERFALKLKFDNGECKKFVMQIDTESEDDSEVSFSDYVFTDEIWSSAKIQDSKEAHRGVAICFSNGFSVSAMKCYVDGTAYVEPEICGEIVYRDEDFTVERCWKWNVNSLYEDKETGLLKTLISGPAFNCNGVSTFASRDGMRLCTVDFNYIDDFHDGLALVMKSGYGYGFVDKDMNLVIPMIYENADEFKDGKAKVKRDGKWLCIDTDGNEIEIKPSVTGTEYQEIGEFSEGLCKVSTLSLGFMDLAYHSDYDNIAGIWGFINEDGEEVIPPQYIYAEDFCSGVAVVCKGKWTIDKKWDNKYNRGKYWTDEELWGAIDKDGNEVVPFIFDEIKHFYDIDDIFIVHYGGWENGHWGVIDNRGNWLADPVFADIDYEYHDGLFAFYPEDKWSDDDVPLGIYDIKQHKVIFEPQFCDVSFCDDGWIDVEVFDKELGKIIEKLIDRDGKEKFHSVYSSIYTWKKPYEVVIWDESGNRNGLIDEDGTVLLPCEFDVPWDGISYEQKLILFNEDGYQGIKDFDGNVIVGPRYNEIHYIDKPLLVVRVGEDDNYKEGIITKMGKEVIPAEFNRISFLKDNYIVCCRDGYCEMLRIESV